MRNSPTVLVAAIFLLGWACATSVTQREVALPTLRQAWLGVRADAELGDAPARLLEAMDDDLRIGVAGPIQARWLLVQPAAEWGADMRPPGLRESCLERVRRFNLLVKELR